MSLARAWRRQLYGASSAALIVPCALLAALMVLALAGGFRSVGVLGQIFAGPPAPPGPGASAAAHGGAGGVVVPASGGAIPVIPLTVAVAPLRRPAPRVVRTGGVVAVPPGGSSRTGGAIAPVGAVGPVVTRRPGAPAGPSPAQTAPARSQAGAQPTQSSPPPPPRKPTPVDGAVKLVTSVTQQVPAPAGPVATQVVRSAGSAANGLLPPSPAGALP